MVRFAGTNGPACEPETFSTRSKALAYHLNAYDALAMHGVLERNIRRDFGNFFKPARFFKFRRVTVDGETTHLYDYENKVIRPLGERAFIAR